jgi:hypothetical protein
VAAVWRNRRRSKWRKWQLNGGISSRNHVAWRRRKKWRNGGSAAKYRRGENGRNRNSITINIIEENRDLAKENRRKKRK